MNKTGKTVLDRIDDVKCNIRHCADRLLEKQREKKETKLGIMTKYGAARYRYRFMSEKHHVPFDEHEGYPVFDRDCILFGRIGNMSIGMHTDNCVCNRTTNTLVIGGVREHDAMESYIMPNLCNLSGSTVVFDPFREVDTQKLKRKQTTIHCIDFEHPEDSWRFNPFILPEKFISLFHKSYDEVMEFYAEVLAEYIEKNLFSKQYGGNDGDPFWKKTEKFILKTLCLYLIKADIPDSKRNFAELLHITREIAAADNIPEALTEYDLCKTFSEVKCPEKTLKAIFVNLIVEMQALEAPMFECFNTKEDTKNMTVENIGGEYQCLIVTGSPDELTVKATNFFFSVLILVLYYYGDATAEGKTGKKSKNFYSSLPVFTHFFLNHFEMLNIANFLIDYSIDRKYGVGFSVITDSIDRLKEKYPNDEHYTLLANSDTSIFLGFPSGKNIVDGTDYETFAKLAGKLYMVGSRKAEAWEHGRHSHIPEGVSYTPAMYPILAPQDIYGKVIHKGKILVCVRDAYPMICERLKGES